MSNPGLSPAKPFDFLPTYPMGLKIRWKCEGCSRVGHGYKEDAYTHAASCRHPSSNQIPQSSTELSLNTKNDECKKRPHSTTVAGEERWECDVCKLVFPTYEKASIHEYNCIGDGYPLLDSSDANREEEDVPIESFLLLDSLKEERSRLSEFNSVAIQNIEFFKATNEDVNNHSTRCRPITEGQLGIRCVHCVKSGVRTPGYSAFPGNLGVLGHNMYLLAGRHFLKRCNSLPKHSKSIMLKTKPMTTSQNMEKDAMGLPSYCLLVAKTVGMINKDGGLRLKVKRRKYN